MPQLRNLQQWMQAGILASEPPPAAELKQRIRPSASLGESDRLEIYRSMYELRLIEALQVDYPGLLRCLGNERFEEVARLYIRHCPSQSYTLNRLGDRLPDFLLQIEGLKRAPFLHDLARFELAETLVFDEEHCTPGTPADLDQNSRLRPIPALHLLAMRYPANRYLKGDSEVLPQRRDTRVVVFRQTHSVAHVELPPARFELLEALCSGKTIGDAVASSKLGEKAIFGCFQQWFGLGWFRS